MIIEWEEIMSSSIELTQRLKVPAGWLIRSLYNDVNRSFSEPVNASIALTFVPDPNHEWQDGWEEKRKAQREAMEKASYERGENMRKEDLHYQKELMAISRSSPIETIKIDDLAPRENK